MRILLFTAGFALLGISVLAQEIPVNVKADSLRYIEGTNIIEAVGEVEVRFKEITIYADSLRMDSESNVATAEGNVRMVAKDYRAFSERVIYDASREVSSFMNFKSILSPNQATGELYVTAGEITDLRDKMLGRSGAVTTCDYGDPHYITTADRVEYYPEDKMVGHNVTLYVDRMPVLWTPYMIYDLAERRKRNWIIGHNEVEGDFIKTAWDYPYGVLYLDEMEKKGLGYGTKVGYNLLGLGLGALYLYHIDEKDTGISDWVTQIKHTKQINSFTNFKLDHNYTVTYLLPYGRKDQTQLKTELDYSHEARWNLKTDILDDRGSNYQKYYLNGWQYYKSIYTNYYYDYTFSKKDPKWIRAAQRFYHRRPLWSDRTTLYTTLNYYNSVASAGAPGDERLEPLVEIYGREDNYSWRITENLYVDLDKDTYKDDDSYQYLEKLPELEISPNPIDLRLFNLRPTFGYGHYHEVRYVPALAKNRSYTTERYQGTLNADQRISLGLGTTAYLGAGLDQFLYAPGDQFYVYRESLTLYSRPSDFFSNYIFYKKGSSDGNSPFLFDSQGTFYHYVQEQMTLYHLDKFRFTIGSGHNWQTHKWLDVDTSLLVKPTEKLYWNLSTGWDIENKRYKSLVNKLLLKPYSFLNMEFSITSDINAGKIYYGSLLYDVLVLEGEPNQWRLRLNQVYEYSSQQFKVRDIMLVKDLHCWEIKYVYSDYRKEFSLTFSLKALPEELGGITSGRGFYIESFEKEIKDITSEREIRRY